MRLTLVTALVALAAATAASAATSPGFLGCKAFTAPHSKLAYRPASIMAACGDGNFYFTHLRWSSWHAATAAAGGIAHQNACKPNCAAGKFHTYLAKVKLSAVKRCHSRTEFTKLSWTFAFAKPAGVARSGSETFRCA